MTRTCVEEVAGRANVVAHIGEISTRETIRLGKQIEKLGVDAVSVITPYFVPLKQQELIAHYTAIADALSVPVFLYNIPARTGNTIEPATARVLAAHPNIIGIKDSAGSYESLGGFLDAVKDIEGFDVLNGPDSLIHRDSLTVVLPVFLVWQTWRQKKLMLSGRDSRPVILPDRMRHRKASRACEPISIKLPSRPLQSKSVANHGA